METVPNIYIFVSFGSAASASNLSTDQLNAKPWWELANPFLHEISPWGKWAKEAKFLNSIIRETTVHDASANEIKTCFEYLL